MEFKIIEENVSETDCIKTTLKDGCCKFLRTQRFGTIPYCHLFETELFDGNDERLKRCESCINAEKSGVLK